MVWSRARGVTADTSNQMSTFITYDSKSFRNEAHLRHNRAQIRTHAVNVTQRRPRPTAASRRGRITLRALASAPQRVTVEDEAICQCGYGEHLDAHDTNSCVEPSKALLLDYENYILPKLFAEQVDVPHEIGHPVWTKPFMDLVIKSTQESLVRLSMIAFAAEFDYRAQFYRLSELAYSRAISALRNSIQSNGSESMEAIMCSVVLLGVWEQVHALRNSTAPKLIHQTAGLELIRFYGNRVLHTATTRHLASALLSRYIWGYYLTSAPSMTEAVDLPRGLYVYSYREGIPQLDELAGSVASLRQSAKDVWMSDCATDRLDQGRANELMSIAASVNADLDRWQRMLPSSYYPQEIIDTSSIDQSIRRAGMYRDLCDVYTSHEKAQTYNSWRTLKIYCLVTMLLIRRESVEISIVKSIRYLLDRICASVPFHIGNLTLETLSEKPAFPPVPTGSRNPSKFTNRHGDAIVYTPAIHAREAQGRGDTVMLQGLANALQTLGYPDQSKMREVLQLLQICPSDDLGDQIQWIIAQIQRVLSLRCRNAINAEPAAVHS